MTWMLEILAEKVDGQPVALSRKTMVVFG